MDDLSRTFLALSDPTRRAILADLAQHERSVGELAAPHAMSLPAISKHIKVLETAGLISRTRDAQWRRCKLTPEPLLAAASWLEHSAWFWDESFRKLDTVLANRQAEAPGHHP